MEDDMNEKYFLGFGFGSRDCAGQRLTLMEMRFAIIELVKRFEIGMKDNWKDLYENAVDAIAVTSKKGIWVQFIKRASSASSQNE